MWRMAMAGATLLALAGGPTPAAGQVLGAPAGQVLGAPAGRASAVRSATTTVAATLTLAVPSKWVVAKAFSVGGVLAPTLADREVLIEELASGQWRRVASGRTDGLGKYNVRVAAASRPKTFTLRAHFTGDASPSVEPTPSVLASEAVSATRKVLVHYVTLRSVGDVNLGDGVATRMSHYGPDYPWRRVGSFLRAADIAFGNLECCISSRGSPEAKTYTFRGSRAALAKAASVGGLDVVSLANNHARDFGTGALVDTLKAVRWARIAEAGAGVDIAAAHKPAILTKDGLKVAFLAYSTIEDDRWGARAHTPGVASAFPVSRMRKEVAAARKKANVVVVSFHWGIQYVQSPEREQVMLGRAAIDAGARLVLGHHPHCLQPMTRYHGGLIAYSLGNFVFAPPSQDILKRTLVLSTALSGKGLASYSTKNALIVDAQPRFVR
jgi:poly-gamma-glutamate capsule biosynthesis protein CapA/YwtB (metallophosphatase superfamily)